MNKYMEILRKAPVFSGLSDREIESLLDDFGAGIRSFGKGEYIMEAGEPAVYIGILLSGKAYIVNEEFWGNRNLVSAIMPGQNFAEAYACAEGAVMGVSVAALSRCTVMFIDAKGMVSTEGGDMHDEREKHAGSQLTSRIMENLLHDMARKNIYFAEKLSHVGERTTRAKLVSYLSSQAEKHHSTKFDIPLSRQELADYLFVDRSGLSAELCKMRDEGLLEFNRNHFELNKII